MKKVNDIIRTELLSRRTVILPEVGALIPQCSEQGAVNVVFTAEWDPEYKSVIDVMESVTGERAQSEIAYWSWLAKNRNGNRLLIPGVGEISGTGFAPDVTLIEEINAKAEHNAGPACHPGPQNKIIVRKGAPWWAVLLIAVATAVVAIFIYRYTIAGDRFIPNTGLQSTGMTGLVLPEAQGPVDIGNEIIPTTEEDLDSQADALEDNDNASSPIAMGSVPGKYYVIAGVYSTEANADKYIRDYKAAYPNLEFGKIPYKGGKILVTIYSSDSETDAERAASRMRRSHYNPELWVYRAK